MLKMSGPRMWLYVRCKSSPAQICRPAVAGDGGDTNERKRMAGYSPAASPIKSKGDLSHERNEAL